MSQDTPDPVATAEALDLLLAKVGDDTGLDVLQDEARRMLHAVIVGLESAQQERDQLRAELTDEIEWGIGCPEDNGIWYQGNFTQRGAHHHAIQRGGGHFPAWRRLTNWHNATKERP